MADAPFISGSDILSYHGDPNLGYSGGGVAYQYNPNITNPLAGVESTIGKLEQEQAAQREMDYRARLEDRQKLASYLAETGGSVFNQRGPQGQNISLQPLPQDYDAMNNKASEIRDYMAKHPNAGSFDKDLMKLVADHRRLSLNAGERAHFYTSAMQEAAQSTDPEERDAILKHAQDEIGKSKVEDFQPITPFMKAPVVDDSFLNKAEIADKANLLKKEMSDKDAQGNALVNTHYYVNPGVLDNTTEIMASPSKKAAATRYVNTYLPSYLNNPQMAISHINEVNAINAKRKALGEEPFPQVIGVTQGPDGQPRVVVNPNLNVAQIAYGLAGAKYARINTDAKLGKTALEIKKQQADIAHTEEETATGYMNAKTAAEKASEAKKDKNDDEWAAQTAAAKVFGAVADLDKQLNLGKGVVKVGDNTGRFTSVKLKPSKEGAAPTETPTQMSFNELVKEKTGNDLSNYDAIRVPISGDIANFGAKQSTDSKGKLIGSVSTPSDAYYLKDASGDKKLVLIYRGNKNMVEDVRVVSPKEAASNYADAMNKFKPEKSHIPLRTQKVWDEMQGTQTPAPKSTSPNAIQSAISNKQYEKTAVKDGQNYFKVNGHWYDSDGNQIQ